MGRGRVPTYAVLGATDLRRHFDKKVADVRVSTTHAPPPSFSAAPSGCKFAVDFQPLTTSDVISAIFDMSTRLQKNCAEIIALFLVELCNKSLLSGSVPSAKSRKFTSIHKVFSYAFHAAAQEGRL